MIKTKKILKLDENKLYEEEIDEKKEVKEKEEQRQKFVAMVSLASELGFSIAIPIAGGALLGQFLDNKFNTNPRMTLSLLFLGLMLAAANIYFIMKESAKE